MIFSRLLALTVGAALTVALAGCAATASSNGALGIWGTPEASNTPGLNLRDDQTVSGTDGCNRLVGSWKMNGDTIEFGPLASTLMACDGVDTWLNGAATATVSGSTMTVIGGDGTEIGTLERGK